MDGWVELRSSELRLGSSDAPEAARPLLQQHPQATKWRLRTCSRLVAPPPEPVCTSTLRYDAVLSARFSSSPLAAVTGGDVVVLVCLHVRGARRLVCPDSPICRPLWVPRCQRAPPEPAAGATGWSNDVTNQKNTSAAEERGRERLTARALTDRFMTAS